jgi:single-strand DNA-binding protein
MPLNKVFLMGNLTRDPELRYTPGGAAVCEFGIAINRSFSSNNQTREEVCFVDIVAWGKTGELCQRYLSKGSQALIEGRLQYDQWEDKATGRRSSRLRVVADNVQFVGARREGGDMPGGNQGAPGGQGNYRSGSNGGSGNYGNGGYGNGNGNYGRPAPQQQGGYAPAGNMPPMPQEAFNPDAGEDDIPF